MATISGPSVDVRELRLNVPSSSNILNGSVVESPTSEHEGLGVQLENVQRRNAPSTISADHRPSAARRRTPSRQLSSPLDDEMTGNPLFGIPDRFITTELAMTPSFSNLAASAVEGIASPAEGPLRRDAGQNQQSSSNTGIPSTRKRTGSLPADDGMSPLRQKIAGIREMQIPGYEKARRIHAVMTEQYESSKLGMTQINTARPHSPASIRANDRPQTPTSTAVTASTTETPLTPTSMLSVDGDADSGFNLTSEDLKPTFIPADQKAIASTSSEIDASDESSLRFGCSHYKRNVKLQCSTCHRWYTCRFCHDELENHALIRKETKNMLCMLCGCAQAAGESCVDCGVRGGWYYCGVCKLWDDDSEKSIYHCADCGLCRVGRGLGKDFFHCKTCGVCLSISMATSHRCIERSTECDCPICGEYMFTSPETVVFMPCGHSIHHKCYYAHMKESYRCPICSKSIVNMESQFRNMDRVIESQPMPQQFEETKALVYCNDCYAKSSVKYHWLGLKCGLCSSYNTAQIQILSGSRPDHLPEPDADGPLHLTNHHSASGSSIPSANADAHAEIERGNVRPTAADQSSLGATEIPAPEAESDAYDTVLLTEENNEEDEVDFWGGESPRDRHLNCLSHEPRNSGSESEDSDEEMGIENDVDDEDDDEDVIDVFGHR